MTKKQKILIVEDNAINRTLLRKILSEKYSIKEAVNGQEALNIINAEKDDISAILLDLVMPVMDGFEFMGHAKEMLSLYNIPIIVVTQSDYEQAELMALSLGATDFILKPYRPQIIHKRLENILELKMTAILRNTAEKDYVTGVYNKESFYKKAFDKIIENSNIQYTIMCVDIDHFKLVNDIFSMAQGDALLKSVAQVIAGVLDKKTSLAARLLGDIFIICMPNDARVINSIITSLGEFSDTYLLDLKISFKFGVYPVNDPSISIDKMCERALLTVKSIKGDYSTNCAFYNEEHHKFLIEEQEITTRMHSALAGGEFVPYYQPKYNLSTGEIVGAEALVRWNHPEEGLLPPIKFISLFEKNGFISALDFYIWECVCKFLKKSIDMGLPIFPISVNMSRVDIHNPHMCDFLENLIKKYDISPHLLEIEITETLYAENSEQLIFVINKLKSLGFIIEMDDFGSGYSSLNMLSEIPVDVLKLDMRFLQSKNLYTKQKNILNFIVSLSRWIGISTVAEGVETIEQVAFLRSMGYKNGQGYFFEKPLSEQNYQALLTQNKAKDVGIKTTNSFSLFLSYSEIWDPTSQFNVLFSGFVGALSLWEYSFKTNTLTSIRTNDLMHDIFKIYKEGEKGYSQNPLFYIFASEKTDFLSLVEKHCQSNTSFQSENRWLTGKPNRPYAWISTHANVIFNDFEKAVLLVAMSDITERKQSEEMLKKNAEMFQRERNFFKHIYDSVPCGIAQFTFNNNEMDFKNANLAMVKMLGYPDKETFKRLNLTFYDLVKEEYRLYLKDKLHEFLKMEAGSSCDLEYEMIKADGSYIWVQDNSEITLDAKGEKIIQSVFSDITKKQNKIEILNEKATRDPLTHLLNRESFEMLTKESLQKDGSIEGAFLILDIDNFKDINDTYGHQFGDDVLKIVARSIRSTLRSSDLTSRIGGDEFSIFLKDLPSEFLALSLAKTLCANIGMAMQKDLGITMGCSIGIAPATNRENDYCTLYKNADSALYEAKQNGKNKCVIFKESVN